MRCDVAEATEGSLLILQSLRRFASLTSQAFHLRHLASSPRYQDTFVKMMWNVERQIFTGSRICTKGDRNGRKCSRYEVEILQLCSRKNTKTGSCGCHRTIKEARKTPEDMVGSIIKYRPRNKNISGTFVPTTQLGLNNYFCFRSPK